MVNNAMDCHILDSISDPTDYKTFTERYFSKRYILDVDGIKNNDFMLMFHSNRITLLTLAPSHFFFNNGKPYTINFSIEKLNRLTNSVKGKGKKGGQALVKNSVICKIEYADGTEISVPSCVKKGTLVEVNDQLVEKPELLREKPDADGYIAIILSSIADSESAKNELMTPEEYLKLKNSEMES